MIFLLRDLLRSQNFPKNISYPLIRTRTRMHVMLVFRKILRI